MKPTAILVTAILILGNILIVGCSFNTKKKTTPSIHGGELIVPEVSLKEEKATPLLQPDQKEATSQKTVKIKPVKRLIDTIEVEGESSQCSGPPFPEKDYSDSIWSKVEIEAEYPGGATAWQRFLNKNLRYPQEEIDNEIQSGVLVQFVVDKEGNVSGVEAIKGSEALGKEAVRVIKKSGKWIPAVQNGVYVKSRKRQPFIICYREK